MRTPGEVRECAHPGKPHKHGKQCYRADGCRCDAGRGYYARQEAERKKQRALGTYRPYLVDTTGSKRRVQALMWLGYTADSVAKRAGISSHAVKNLLRDKTGRVRREKAEAIERVYDDLWDNPAPLGHGARYVSRQARRLRFVPPAGWDDETIDDPHAQPSVLVLDPAVLPFERRAEIAGELLSLGGMDKKAIAARASVSVCTVTKLQRRSA